MAPNTTESSTGTSFSENKPKNGKGEGIPQASAQKEVEDPRREQDLNKMGRLPIRCTKCNKKFESFEQRTVHIKTSSRHYCCGVCEGIVEFKDFFRQCLHYEEHHRQLYCFRCGNCFESAENLKVHNKFSQLHYCCQHCEGVVEFESEFELRSHYKHHHPLSWCHSCERYFPTFDKLFVHIQHFHDHCDGCYEYFSSPEILTAHRITCEKVNPPMKEEDPEPSERNPNANMAQTHYATLDISPDSSHEQIVKAAKKMRIKMHPDRLKRQGGLTEEQEKNIDVEAALVGQAADVLSDLELRREYDRRLRE